MIDRAFRDMHMVAEDSATFTCIFGKYHIIFLIKKLMLWCESIVFLIYYWDYNSS